MAEARFKSLVEIAKRTQTKMLTLLEHLNFKIPYPVGEEIVKDFFIGRLGCPECPTGRLRVAPPVKGPIKEGEAKQIHVNMGLSQIHFEWCTGDGRPFDQPQRLEGCVTLAVKDLQLLKSKVKNVPHVVMKDDSVVLTDPFGITTWVCIPASKEIQQIVAKFGSVRAGGVGNVLAMTRVDYDVRPGASKTIAEFYSKAFSCPTLKHSQGYSIQTNFNQVISFNETPTAPPENGYEVRPNLWAIHMCFYIDDFDTNARRLRDLFWVNPDYRIPPINDDVSNVESALKRKQFRMKHIGDKFVFEHEIRATDHPLSPLNAHKAKL